MRYSVKEIWEFANQPLSKPLHALRFVVVFVVVWYLWQAVYWCIGQAWSMLPSG